MNNYFIYILTNELNNVIYTGITNDITRRIFEHKNKLVKGFTSRYNIDKLVYYEETSSINSALEREKQIKGWLKKKKITLIESNNPLWKDLSDGFFQ